MFLVTPPVCKLDMQCTSEKEVRGLIHTLDQLYHFTLMVHYSCSGLSVKYMHVCVGNGEVKEGGNIPL